MTETLKYIGTHLIVLRKSFPKNTDMKGFSLFSNFIVVLYLGQKQPQNGKGSGFPNFTLLYATRPWNLSDLRVTVQGKRTSFLTPPVLVGKCASVLHFKPIPNVSALIFARLGNRKSS